MMESLPINILIVDDDPFIRTFFKDLITEMGYTGEVAEDAQAAIAKVKSKSFDIIFTDLMMPKTDGIELLQMIKNINPEVPVIMVTAYGSIDTAVEAIRRGAYTYITKPINQDELSLVIQRVIEKRQTDVEKNELQRIVAIYKITTAMSSTLDKNKILQILMTSAIKITGAECGSIFILDQTNKTFSIAAQVINQPPLKEELTKIWQAVVEKTLQTKESLILDIRNADAEKIYFGKNNTVKSTITIPLVIRKEFIGVLILSNLTSSRYFTQKTKNTLSILATEASTALENAKLFEDRQKSYFDIIEALVKVIEETDTYTAGHSKRVTEYSVNIARELGLPEKEIDVLKHAAVLHDIGKIGVNINILHKNGKLTPEEFALVRNHPLIAERIIDHISFLDEVKVIVRQHHDWYNGEGYRHRKPDEDLHLSSRILTVADAYDAMASTRPYRQSLPRETAIAELKKFSGTQFDPKVVEAFIKTLNK